MDYQSNDMGKKMLLYKTKNKTIISDDTDFLLRNPEYHQSYTHHSLRTSAVE